MKRYLIAAISLFVAGCQPETQDATGGSGGCNCGGAGGSGGIIECVEASDCLPTSDPCQTSECDSGQCVAIAVTDGEPCPAQSQFDVGQCVGGECVVSECFSTEDCSPIGECEVSECANGKCHYMTAPEQSICDGGNGQCVLLNCLPNGCIGEPNGQKCVLCDMAGVCMDGLCYQSQSGPPHCD